MFTGIVEEIGKILSITTNVLTVMCDVVLRDVALGDSISVNGVCLTVSEFGKDYFKADISPETCSATMLRDLKYGDYVNLERAMKADGRFGGHIVSGHVDGIGKIISLKNDGNFYNLSIELKDTEVNYVVKKGSVTINGISLTIANIERNIITLAIIPHTFENTNLKFLKIGDNVNIETDIIAKYIEKFLSTSDNKSRIDVDFLQRNGFY